ncbi:hypothetical protein [Agrobacterium tumefaciens]|nr:hypothetical protein [Agrobacterium tumefaciens]
MTSFATPANLPAMIAQSHNVMLINTTSGKAGGRWSIVAID